MTAGTIGFLALAGFIVAPSLRPAYASETKQEHPSEHPSGKKHEHPAEHPKREHPAEHPSTKAKSEVTAEDIAAAVENYVKKEAAASQGVFHVFDHEANQHLNLILDKVHKERLSKVGEGVYFACADFKAEDGKTYDLDIFMKGPDKDHLEVTEVSVHKENGKERYTWYEEEGVWKKKPVSEE